MSDTPKLPKVENRISLGNFITIASGVIALGVAFGSLNSDIRALAQRVEQGEKRDEKTGDAIDAMKGAIIELRADGKATRSEMERLGRQFDRIEGALQRVTPPANVNPRGTP